MSLFSHTCILRARGAQTGTDQYGRPVYGPDVDTTSPAWWEISSESETTDAANQYTSQYILYLPLTASLDGWDTVILDTVPDVDGNPAAAPAAPEYQAVGRPGKQPGGFIVEGYFRILLELVTG